jgi:hypothetical protein
VGAGYRAPAPTVFLTDERFDGALTGWTNVKRHVGGTQSGLPYCGEKIQVDLGVTYTYGTLAAYREHKPYLLTWWEKNGSGYWERKWQVSRSYYAGYQLPSLQVAWPGSAEALLIDQLRIRELSQVEYAESSDAQAALDFPGVDVHPYPDDSHLALIPLTMEKLRNGGTLRVALVCDSYGSGISSMPFEGIISRSYPLADIVPQIHAIGSTGADNPLVTEGAPDVPFYGWDSDSRIATVAAAAPDLIIFCGISSTFLEAGAAHWTSMVGKMRAAMPGVEIVLSSRANGFAPDNITVDTTGITSAYVRAIAEANGCAFWDASLCVRQLCEDAGIDPDDLRRVGGGYGGDGIHHGNPGKNMAARGLAAWFGALPGANPPSVEFPLVSPWPWNMWDVTVVVP